MRVVEPADLSPAQRHALFTGLLLPHAIAMISTTGPDGEPVVAPLGYCLPLRGQQATIAVTIAAVRDAGGEPEQVRAAALATGELVANLTTTDLAAHLVELGRAERDPLTGAVRWPTVASRRVSAPSLVTSRARLECRVLAQPAQPGGSRPGGSAPGGDLELRTADPRPGPGYVVIAEVVCVVADDDLLDPLPARPVAAAAPIADRAEFPWFFGPQDGSVVGGAVERGSRHPTPIAPMVVDGSTG